MNKRITYLLGAGASANALPVVEGIKDRFQIFCDHFLKYMTSYPLNSEILSQVALQQDKLCASIGNHYTVDTYAKKLFLQNPDLSNNSDYNLLTNYLSAYFLYEQLKFDMADKSNAFISEKINSPVDNEGVYKDQSTKILKDFDYRYDSLFASILEFDEQKKIKLPDNVNIISWNYDFQIEKAFMNFTGSNLNEAIRTLNIYGAQENPDYNERKSSIIKLNGTAAFIYNDSFGELFDFKEHQINKETFKIFEEILLAKRTKSKNAIRFAWENADISKRAIKLAKDKISQSEIVVIIGYSFPYFNRNVDREIFSGFVPNPNRKVYIQSPASTIESTIKRFAAVTSFVTPEPFTEVDQFLIPNEL